MVMNDDVRPLVGLALVGAIGAVIGLVMPGDARAIMLTVGIGLVLLAAGLFVLQLLKPRRD